MDQKGKVDGSSLVDRGLPVFKQSTVYYTRTDNNLYTVTLFFKSMLKETYTAGQEIKLTRQIGSVLSLVQ